MKSGLNKIVISFALSVGMLMSVAASFDEDFRADGIKLMQLKGVSTNRTSATASTKGKTISPKIVKDVVPTRLNVGNYCLNVTKYKQGCYSWEDQDDSSYWGDIRILRLPSHGAAIEKAFTSIAICSLPVEMLAKGVAVVQVNDDYMRIANGKTLYYLIVDNYMIDVRVNAPLSVKRGEEKITAEQLADAVLKVLTSQK